MGASTDSAKLGKKAELDDSGLAHLIGYAVVRADLVLAGAFKKSIGQTMNLRPVEFTLLTLLADNGPVAQKALAAKLSVAAPNLTVILNRLTARDLISTSRNELDGRSVLVGLSAAGKGLQAKAWQASKSMESEVLSTLSPAEQKTLQSLLWRVHTSSNDQSSPVTRNNK